MSAQQVLDRVQSIASIAAFEAAPQSYAHRLRAELGTAITRDDLYARDERLRDALAQVDALVERVMRIRIDHGLAHDTAIQVPTRKVFASTVTSYEGRLDLLASRARDVAAKGGSGDPAGAARAVVECATAALSLRRSVRGELLSVISALALEGVALADSNARERKIDEAVRRSWSSLRRELEAVATQPERILGAAIAVRLASWPTQLDEPDPALDPKLSDLLELD